VFLEVDLRNGGAADVAGLAELLVHAVRALVVRPLLAELEPAVSSASIAPARASTCSGVTSRVSSYGESFA
jgi:hypothetical protein